MIVVVWRTLGIVLATSNVLGISYINFGIMTKFEYRILNITQNVFIMILSFLFSFEKNISLLVIKIRGVL